MILAKPNETIAKQLNASVFPGLQGGPLMHVIAAKAVAFHEASQPAFKTYQAQVLTNATTLASALQALGYHIISGGTDNHLMLVDLRPQQLTGKVADTLLHSVGITANKNTIPNDPCSPFVTSGLRLGTPAVTTRGFKAPEMQQIATWIDDILKHPQDTARHQRIKQAVEALCQQFPVYA